MARFDESCHFSIYPWTAYMRQLDNALHQHDNATLHLAGRLSPYKKQIVYALHQLDNALHQLDNAALYLAGRLSPYKIAKINTQTSKLVGCYFIELPFIGTMCLFMSGYRPIKNK